MEGKIIRKSFKSAIPTYSRQVGTMLIIMGVLAGITLLFPLQAPWKRHTSLLYSNHSMAGSFVAADYAFKRQDFDEAAPLFLAGLKKNPKNSVLLERAYLASVLAGNMSDALSILHRYASPTSMPVTGITLLTLEALRNENYTEAANLLQIKYANELAVNVVISPFLLSWCDAGQRKYKEALDRLAALPTDTGNHAFALYQMALIADLAGMNTEAENYFKLALKQEEGSYRFIKAMGNFYERTKQREKAIELYKTYQGDNNTSPFFKKDLERASKKEFFPPPRLINNVPQGVSQILLEVASSFYKVQMFTEAQIYLQMALYLEPALPQAHFLIARYYEETNFIDKAIAHYQTIDKSSDFYWQSQINIALNLFKEGNLKEAKAQLLTLSKSRPSDYEVLLILADILRSESRIEEAINVYTQLLTGTNQPPSYYWYVYYMRAISYDQSNQWEKAESDLEAALKLSPDQHEVLNYLGYSWVERGQHIAQAKEMISTALAQNPQNPQYLDSMGWALLAEGDYSLAIDYLEDALELLPTDSTINAHLGDAYLLDGRKREAQFQWQRALSLAPEAKEAAKIKDKLEKSGIKLDEAPSLEAGE